MDISVVPPLMKKMFLENPFVDRKLVSRDGNHVGSLELGLRARDSSPGSQTRPHSQTFPLSPLRLALTPQVSQRVWEAGQRPAQGWVVHTVAALLLPCPLSS